MTSGIVKCKWILSKFDAQEAICHHYITRLWYIEVHLYTFTSMSILRLIPLFLLVLMTGCASLSPHAPDTTTARSSGTSESVSEQANLPSVEMDGTMLFRLLTADMAVQHQQFALAANLYLLVAEETNDPRLAEQATRMALISRRDQDALVAARLWLDLVPDSRDALEGIISAEIRNGNEQDVQEHLERLLASSDSGDREQDYNLIISLLQHGRDSQMSLRIMQQLGAHHAQDADAQFALAYIALQAGDLVLARTAIESSLAIRPHRLNSMNLYGQVIRMQGRPFEAAVYLAGVVKEFPDNLQIRVNYARLLVENRQLDEALEQYQWLVKKEPYNGEILFVTALLSLQLNDLDTSQDLFQRLVDMGQRLDVAHFYLGQIADLHKETDIAIDHYTEVTKGEHFLDAQIRMVKLLAARGDLLLARGHLEKLRAQMPTQLGRIDLVEGQILSHDGQFDEAMAIYEKALLRDPDDQGLLYSQALLAEKMQRYELAEKNLSHILELDPDNVSALNALGYALADRSTRYQEALGYIQKAVELRPHSAAILDSMGWVLYRLGRLDESLGYLRQSLEISQDQEVAAHLGEVLWMRGEHDEARTVWDQALERTPDDKMILDVMKRFGQ